MGRADPADLACPDCRGPLRPAVPPPPAPTPPPSPPPPPGSGAGLRCQGCGRSFPVREGVPRLHPAGRPEPAQERTLRAFERQWRSYGRLPRLFGKDPRAMARNLVGARLSRRIDATWYAGRRVLDAGCGHGRYLPAFAAMGARVVGLDARISRTALDRARGEPAVALVEGSVASLPFRDGAFDLAFCDGVIHHTPDPARAFAELARVVRPGGAVYVWVYPREGALREAVFGAARRVTTRLPGAVVRALSFALAPLTLAVRSYSGTRLGRATWSECAQVVHDWIAPPLQSHHDYAELAGWAVASGLRDLERLPVPTGLTGWKPA